MKVTELATADIPHTISLDSSNAKRSLPPECAVIVLVEDDADTRETVAEFLEDEGYSVTTAQNGAEALGKLTENPVPRLIILDLNMPELNGADFAHRLLMEPTFGRVPLLVVSGSATGRQQAALLGADAFIAKPMHVADLLEQVSFLLHAD